VGALMESETPNESRLVRRLERRRERRKTVNMPKTSKSEKPAVRSSKLVGELEAALRICKDLESASRAHGMWGYEDDWNALTTFISQRLDSERGRSFTGKHSDTAP